MKLTLYSDYCLRVLLYLGLKDDELATIREIADRYGISRNHLMKVVYELNRAGYIETLRGKRGGMRLRRAPADIGIGELIRTTEGDFLLVECFGTDNHCRITDACRMRPLLREALEAFFSVLDRYTLADLLDERRELRALVNLPEPARPDAD